MDNFDNIGRISKLSFKISTTILFVACLLCVSARFFIRVGIQRELTADDGFLLFGTLCLIAAMVILYINMDNMYFTEALIYATPAQLAATTENINQLFHRVFIFHKLVNASLILSWAALVAVKFSFLALFKRLIDRMPPLIRFWWFTVIFNIAVSIWGTVVYFIACPYFSGSSMIKCLESSIENAAVRYAVSQMVLDLIGDFLILYIPGHLIYKVDVALAKKIALIFSLCLTAVVIGFTVTRAGGLRWQGKLDALWEIYFQVVSAEVGLILVSSTAFRTLFVSRAAAAKRRTSTGQKTGSSSGWWPGGKSSSRKLSEGRDGWSKSQVIATTNTTNTIATSKDVADWVANDSQAGVLSVTRSEPGAGMHHRERLELREIATRHQASRGDENLGLRTFMNDPSDERLAEHDIESGEFGYDLQRNSERQRWYGSEQDSHHHRQKHPEVGAGRVMLF